LADYDLEHIVSLYEIGISCRDIGTQYGVAGSSINKFLRKNGIQTRNKLEAIQYRNYGTAECIACGDIFDKIQSGHKLCIECIPNTTWRRRWQEYGVTKKIYDNLLEKQDGLCPLCSISLNYDTGVVDHCHFTGTVRGILCVGCNLALGKFDNPEFLARAFSYLKLGRQ
jgi:Recombination endonuclease VII